jgi:uncharacterized phosphosugar-binding protein
LPCAHDDGSGVLHGPVEYARAGGLIQIHPPVSGSFYHHKTLRNCNLNRIEDRGKHFDGPEVWQPTDRILLLKQDDISR